MLESAEIAAVVPVSEIDKACEFYGDKLGFREVVRNTNPPGLEAGPATTTPRGGRPVRMQTRRRTPGGASRTVPWAGVTSLPRRGRCGTGGRFPAEHKAHRPPGWRREHVEPA